VLNVAHRGASGHAPEHTFSAYDLALTTGADALELDVHMTRDGALVVFHDATLDRVTGRSGLVRDASLAELKALDAGAWFGPRRRGLRIPTLGEVFTRYGTATGYYVEMKDPELYPGMEEELVRAIAEHGLSRHAVVQSFSAPGLQRVVELDSALPVVRLYPEGAPISQTLEETARYATGIGPSLDDVDAALVARARTLGLRVLVYTVDSPADMRALAALGVDAIVTNFPARLARSRVTTAGALR
jgi:glycerophosphoryl diester phosphodiesterase